MAPALPTRPPVGEERQELGCADRRCRQSAAVRRIGIQLLLIAVRRAGPHRAASDRSTAWRQSAERRMSIGCFKSHRLIALNRIMARRIGSWTTKARPRWGMSLRVVRAEIHKEKM